ncbi:hypothetical protein EMIHUDRAFT_469516 [Emiliania huxleyi CCMP1516]|uniref:RelA/SpoT domain-containing protein n=2 Tax=Emiliania huxleyi TaxID=2903 RepID=A0A0D3JJ15_EMIH1|nr:hypothetical protein EMIHUDRAFT_469516 [Emiliania huxleyi CCMP1516]EOD23500.1 hypothetical protein EMIHUDRAFT_469516 [Emiliania huxleyi CCMP1516]|eukprot:XP_005775929.1 hypothetical protein EMIHUDRAFT_469516 [Emiliania huxleyi CCMP1516]
MWSPPRRTAPPPPPPHPPRPCPALPSDLAGGSMTAAEPPAAAAAAAAAVVVAVGPSHRSFSSLRSAHGPGSSLAAPRLHLGSSQLHLGSSRLHLGSSRLTSRLISAASRLHLGCTSAASRLHLGCISAAPRPHLGCISAAPRPHLGCISAAPRARFVAGCLAAADGAATATGLQRWLRTAFAESVCAVAFPGAFGAVRAWHGQLSAAGSEELEEAARRVEAALAASLPAGSYRVEARDVALRGKRADDLLGLRVVLDGHREYGAAGGYREYGEAAGGLPRRAGDHSRCLAVRQVAGRLWGEVAFSDYIASPKANGYCSLHSTYALPSGTPLELQARDRGR